MKQRKVPKGQFPAANPYERDIAPGIKYKATGEYRTPNKGEWYLSGAIILAYLSPGNLNGPYWIAKPITMKPCPTCKGCGEVPNA